MPTIVIKSIGSNARDYATLQEWLDAIPADLVAVDEQWIGECYNDSEFVVTGNFGTSVSITADATRNITLRTAAGEGFADDPGAATNPIRYDQTKGVAFRSTGTSNNLNGIRIRAEFTVIDGLQVQGPYGNSSQLVFLANGDSVVQNCIVHNTSPTSAGRTVRAGSVGMIIKNNALIVSSIAGVGIALTNNFNDYFVFGNTLIALNGSTGNGIDITSTDPTLNSNNNSVFGFASVVGGNALTDNSDYNASDTTNGLVGANSDGTLVTVDQFESITPGSEDLRAKTTGGLQFGLPDATNIPNDIIGTLRDLVTIWVGCWENTTTGPPPGQATLTGVGLLDATGFDVTPDGGQATMLGVGLLDASAMYTAFAAATLTGRGLLDANGLGGDAGQASMTGVGLLDASAIGKEQGAASMTGIGTIDATPGGKLAAVASLAGIGLLDATGFLKEFPKGAATLTGKGLMSARGIDLNPAPLDVSGRVLRRELEGETK